MLVLIALTLGLLAAGGHLLAGGGSTHWEFVLVAGALLGILLTGRDLIGA